MKFKYPSKPKFPGKSATEKQLQAYLAKHSEYQKKVKSIDKAKIEHEKLYNRAKSLHSSLKTGKGYPKKPTMVKSSASIQTLKNFIEKLNAQMKKISEVDKGASKRKNLLNQAEKVRSKL